MDVVPVNAPEPGSPSLYGELASWFHLLTAPDEYEEEATLYRRLILERCGPHPRVLELGSGGGNNAFHLKAHMDLTLTDISPEMLELSRSINPGCVHVEGDMRTLRLEERFDAVFAHDALDYMTSEQDLRAVFHTIHAHLDVGGTAVLVPDHLRETFEPSTDHGGNDEGGRGMRYLQWTWDPDPDDSTYVADFAYLLREDDGSLEVVHDRHVCGLFSEETWTGGLRAAGFEVALVEAGHDEPEGQAIFLATKMH